MLQALIHFILLTLVMSAEVLHATDRGGLLELRVNGVHKGTVSIFFRGDDILARLVDLEPSGLASLGGRRVTIDGKPYVSLRSLAPALTFGANAKDLSLDLTVTPSKLNTVSSYFTQSEKKHIEGSQEPNAAFREGLKRADQERAEIINADVLEAAGRRGIVELRVNGVRAGTVGIFFRSDDILARLADLELSGLMSLGSRRVTIRETTYISLRSLAPAVKFDANEENLSLELTVMGPNLSIDSTHFDHSDPRHIQTPREPGTTLRERPQGPESIYSDTVGETPADNRGGTDHLALLDLDVNGVHKGEVVVILRGDDALCRLADLKTAGLMSVAGRTVEIKGENYVSLKSLASEVTFKVDEQKLALRLTVAPSALGSNFISLHKNRPPKIEYREDSSAFLNYAFNLRDFSRFDTYGEAGLAFNSNLLYSGISRTADGLIVRGLSNFTINQREKLNRTVLGDRLVASDVLGGNLILGGISYFREFGLDPYFARNPGLHYSGAVATPSTMDVYVNGLFFRRIPLPPGQFELRDLPVPAGSADARFVLRDAFGREQEFLSPFYFTSGLLKKGLHEFSYNLGAQRNKLATESWSYGTPVFLGRHRVGMTDALTAGLRFEASPRVVSGGPSVSFLLPFGEMEFVAAGSYSQGLLGSGLFVGYSYGGRLFNFGTSLRFLSPSYATTSLGTSDPRSRLQVNTTLGFSVADRTGVSLRYALDNSVQEGAAHRFILSTTTRLLNRLNMFVRGSYLLADGKGSNEIALGFSYLFGDTSATLAYEYRDEVGSGIASAQKSLPVGPGFGYRLQARTGQGIYEGDGLLQYQGPYGRLEAYFARLAGRNTTLLSTAGGVALIGGDLFLTRPVQESYALIQVPGLGGIRGYLNNLEIGSSNTQGNLFVPNLLPYYGNNLSISAKDIPVNYNIMGTIKQTIAPPYRGGAVVTFPVQRIQRTYGTLTLETSGQRIVPSYGQLAVVVNGDRFESPIGKGGQFYLENVPAGRHKAVIQYQGTSCEFEMNMPNSQELEVEVGKLSCVEQQEQP